MKKVFKRSDLDLTLLNKSSMLKGDKQNSYPGTPPQL